MERPSMLLPAESGNMSGKFTRRHTTAAAMGNVFDDIDSILDILSSTDVLSSHYGSSA